MGLKTWDPFHQDTPSCIGGLADMVSQYVASQTKWPTQLVLPARKKQSDWQKFLNSHATHASGRKLSGDESKSSMWKIPGYLALSPRMGYLVRLEKRNFIHELHDELILCDADWWYIVPKKDATPKEENTIPVRRGRKTADVFYDYDYAEGLARYFSFSSKCFGFIRSQLVRTDGLVIKNYIST
jgi:hypothetical protein